MEGATHVTTHPWGSHEFRPSRCPPSLKLPSLLQTSAAVDLIGFPHCHPSLPLLCFLALCCEWTETDLTV